MDIQTVLILVAIGLAAGFLSGMVGIGGGIIIVPALVYLLGYTQKGAQGTSLAVLLLPIGILAVWQYYKYSAPGQTQGLINIKAVGLIALAFLGGSFLGSKAALSLSDDKLKKFFAIFIMLIAIKMLFFDKKKTNTLPKDNNTTTTTNNTN